MRLPGRLRNCLLCYCPRCSLDAAHPGASTRPLPESFRCFPMSVSDSRDRSRSRSTTLLYSSPLSVGSLCPAYIATALSRSNS
jgi:hypothetical protein